MNIKKDLFEVVWGIVLGEIKKPMPVRLYFNDQTHLSLSQAAI